MTEQTIQATIPPFDGGGIDDQAEEWLVYLYSGDASELGHQRFSRWLKTSPAHASAYARAEQLWRDMGFVSVQQTGVADANPAAESTIAPEPAAAAKPAAHRPAAAPTSAPAVGSAKDTPAGKPAAHKPSLRLITNRSVKSLFAMAATLLLATGVWFFQDTVFNTVEPVHYSSKTGEIKTVTLEDGSVVTLSATTVLITRFSSQQREVELLKGGAFFEVTPDKSKPFHIRVADTAITVVGTKFDVQKSPSNVRVAVTEGLVDVTTSDQNASAEPARARLKAGQRIIARTDGGLSEVQTFNPKDLLAWRDGRLVYVDARLEDVIEEVNRYRTDKIVLSDPDLKELRITTAFRANQSNQLLTGLEATRPVEISRLPTGILIKPKSEQ